MSREQFMQSITALVQSDLRPLVSQVDRDGLYPVDFLTSLGRSGAYACLGTEAEGGLAMGLGAQIEVIRRIGRECGATAFLAWCQSACAWYLHKSKRHAVRERYLKDVLQGAVLAGTGMSNTVKHLSGIGKHFLKAEKVEDGYIINGMLPWVSNIGENHVWATTAKINDRDYVMFMTGGHVDGISLYKCPEFSGLEGTRTLGVKFKNVFVRHDDVLADEYEFESYVEAIKPGFILLQIGIGAGIIDGCVDIMRERNPITRDVNRFLHMDADGTQACLDQAWDETLRLADLEDCDAARILDVLQNRLAAAELCLSSAQAAALHAGAKGYLVRHPAQRRMREAMFVAIVTPAIKHLRKEINELQGAALSVAI